MKKFKSREVNQRISASVQGTPRRGKSISVQAFIETLLPFQGAIAAANLPRAMPWAMRLLGLQPTP